MRKISVIVAAVLLCGLPFVAQSQEVITGEKYNAFLASSGNYMNRPVILEDTFKSIQGDFSKAETDNNLTNNRHVKFRLGRFPGACIGSRIPPVMDGLKEVGPGDLVRVTGSLREIKEKPVRIKTTGKFKSGRKYKERSRIYGPDKTEIYLNVSKVEKGWGAGDSIEEMAEEGKSLRDEDYIEVKPGDSQLERDVEAGKLTDRAIRFRGDYKGIDSNLTDLEKAAGLTSENAIKFSVESGTKTIPCYIPFSEANLQGFKNLPVGTEVIVSGRIRKRETPKGTLGGFVADRVDGVVVREETAPDKQ